MSTEWLNRCDWLLFTMCVVLGGCWAEGPRNAGNEGAERSVATSTTADEDVLILSAAASTREAIETLVDRYQTRSGTRVKLNLGSSSALANQIIAGAPADLFLSANRRWAEEVRRSGKVLAATALLTNRLVLVVPAGNPADVEGPQDLLSPQVTKIALAGEKVPAGIYADQTLASLNLLDNLVAEGKIVRGQDVRSALSYVERGEVEAGIVYSTDLGAASGLSIVHEFDPRLHDEIVYVLVLLRGEERRPQAQQFYDYLQSSTADSVYTSHGFTRLH